MFIYEIRNKINGKRLIGQTVQRNVNYRWSDHKRKLRQKTHDNPHLQNAWRRYGESNFEFSVIEDDIDSIDRLNYLEIYYIDKFNARNPDHGYNIREGGRNGKLSDSTKQKLQGRIPWNKGRAWTKEERKRISQGLVGRKFTKKEQDKRSKRDYPIVLNPQGKEYNIVNLARFCREHDLNRNGMWAIISNRQKSCYGGWKVKK
ncbi:hypothetical protein LCGC14_0843550 [marine sediment metagenome]|uniref:GIY-YIG domain-containing protein n=1 Tax=marine sediment metagenome TaxID=412755 RepID=A0A0F9RX17_9ZZZZ